MLVKDSTTGKKQQWPLVDTKLVYAIKKPVKLAILSLPNQILGNVQELLSNEVKEQKAGKRKIFLKILEIARQGLPLRGYVEIYCFS